MNSLNCLKYLLKLNLSPDGSETASCCPLSIAARENFLDCMRILLQYGANPNGREEPFSLKSLTIWDHFNCSIDTTSTTRPTPEIPSTLPPPPPPPDMPPPPATVVTRDTENSPGAQSPLHTAVIRQNEQAAILLIKHGADINLSYTDTNIIWLCLRHQASLAFLKLVLDLGARLYVKNQKTPILLPCLYSLAFYDSPRSSLNNSLKFEKIEKHYKNQINLLSEYYSTPLSLKKISRNTVRTHCDFRHKNLSDYLTEQLVDFLNGC